MQAMNRQFTKLDKLVEPGTIIKVPSYKVGANQLLFFWNGVLCVPGEDYQYVEIGDIGSISTEVKINFPLKATDEITFISFPITKKEGA